MPLSEPVEIICLESSMAAIPDSATDQRAYRRTRSHILVLKYSDLKEFLVYRCESNHTGQSTDRKCPTAISRRTVFFAGAISDETCSRRAKNSSIDCTSFAAFSLQLKRFISLSHALQLHKLVFAAASDEFSNQAHSMVTMPVDCSVNSRMDSCFPS